MKALTDVVTDKRYRSRKWWGFLILTAGLFVLLLKGIDASQWVQWGSIGYAAFCASNTALKWKGVES